MEWLIDWFNILIDLIWYIDWLKITSQITFSTFSSFFPLNKVIEISTPTPNLFFPYNYSVYEIFCSSIINHVYTIGLHLIKLYYVYYIVIQYILSLSCWQIVINDFKTCTIAPDCTSTLISYFETSNLLILLLISGKNCLIGL